MDPLAWIDDELAELDEQDLLRRRVARAGKQAATVTIDGKEYVNFSSNDYLNLAGDPRLSQAAIEATSEYGWGGGASPLITGYSELQRQLEEELAAFFGTHAALVFSSGYAANIATVGALVGPGDCVFGDHRNHASLIDGCRLSGARFRTWKFGGLERLKNLLARESACHRRLIVTDSLFSMDGDFAPLAELADIAQQYQAMLMVDEAHAVGVFGASGCGLVEELGLDDVVDVRVATLSKSIGCMGGVVAGSQRLVDWLVNRARSYIFSTAPPPANAAAARVSLNIVRDEPERRRQLLAAADQLRQRLAAAGCDLGPSQSHIIPVITGDAKEALDLSARLRAAGLWVPAIRPPAVSPGSSRLRISLTAGHTAEMIDQLVAALGNSA